MEKNDTSKQENEVLARLLKGAGLRRHSQLAELLEVSPQAISQARRKGKIPEAWVVKVAALFQLSTDWLFFGRGHPGLAQEVSAKESEGEHTPANERAKGTKGQRQNALEKGLPLADAPFLGEAAVRYQSIPAPLAEARPMDIILLPQVAARLAAGYGSLETEGEVVDHFAFSQDWLCRLGNPERMVLMEVTGNSMEPDIKHGDKVLVDQGKTQIYGHAIYAVGVNEEIYIKQVETLPGNRLVLRSLNPRYEPIEVFLGGDLADSVHIIGRVLWWCHEV